MSGGKYDKDTEKLAEISLELQREYAKRTDDGWRDSPFYWILLRRSSRQRGKIGEQLIERYLKLLGIEVKPSPDSDADRLINGRRVEVKFSSLWENGQYLFQQIRDQDYEYLLCLGVSPFKVHTWVIKKSDIPFDKLHHQHGGERGRDTWWFSFKPDLPPHWLPGKGTLQDIHDLFAGVQ